jgi:sugar O-acyltransferase (sialic acid O-acetyltransferase NeuD family)
MYIGDKRMAKVVVFGIQDFASLAHFYLNEDSPHEVVAFSVTKEYMPSEATFEGVPVVPFEELEKLYPSSHFSFFAPMSHRKMNKLRAKIYTQAKGKGYKIISYISSKATIFSNVSIGENCFILENNTIQPFVSIGNNVVLWSGNHIGHHSIIKDHVLLTSHVVISGHCVIEPYSFFGVNSTLRDGLNIARGTLIAMGACVTKDTDEWGVYTGIPAKKGKMLSKDLDI